MGVGQQRVDRQLVGAAGQVGAAGAADLSVERLPPGVGRDEMTVALACEGAHAVTDGQAAQAQEFGDRHTIGAGQAWAALAAAFHPQVLGVEPAFPGAGLAPSLPGRREPGKGGGPGQIAGLLGPQPQGGDPLINQKAVGQLLGGTGRSPPAVRPVVHKAAPSLAGRRDGHHAKSSGRPGPIYLGSLQRIAVSLSKRDQKRGSTGKVQQYRLTIHQEVMAPEGREHWTGEWLDWDLINTYDNGEAAASKGEHKRQYAMLPTIHHRYNQLVQDFVICAWCTNDAKHVITPIGVLEFCKAVLNQSANWGEP